MYILTIALLFHASSVLAFPILQRDAASIDAAITNIEGQISTLNNTLNGFAPYQPTAIITVLKVKFETDKLGDAISSATQTIGASQPLDDDDSLNVAEATLNLEPMIFSLLDNIVAKKNAFDTAVLGIASVSATVKQSLEKQKQLSADLGQALVSKLSSFFSGPAGIVNADIATHFSDAINAYSVSGGTIPLPPVPGH